MSPELQRIALVVLGVACLALAYLMPEQRELLLATGVGLLGWAKKAPGHDGGGTTAATLVFLVLLSENLVSCTPELPPPCDAATYAGIMARCQVAIRAECPSGTGQCDTRDRCIAELKAREATCLAR